MKTIHVPPLGWLARFADWAMFPVMYLVSGTLSESPQRTHRWNNKKLRPRDVQYLLPHSMVHSSGTPSSGRFWWKMPLFHLPVFGGWRHYIVLEPLCPPDTSWHVGWITRDVVGVSRITSRGPVRVLLGSENVLHFGLYPDGTQLFVKKIGEGTIGDEGQYALLPLL